MRIGCVDLFCGAGGLSVGLQAAGIDVVLGVDADEGCRFAFEHNTGVEFRLADVGDLAPKDVLDALSDHDYTVLAGCAPCQPFSTYTHGRSAREEDRGWTLLDDFADLVEVCRPDFVTMENVWKLARHPVFDRFVTRLRNVGYDVRHSSVNCEQYAIPQRRRRLVLMASLVGEAPWPISSSVTAPMVREVIGDLPPIAAGSADPYDRLHCASKLSAKNLERIRASRPGGTWRDWPPELVADCHRQSSGRTYPSVYGRMTWDDPAPTITGQCYGFGNGRFGHPEQDRALSLREAALLQTFPRNAEFVAPDEPVMMKHVGQMIGNAVPPKLGEAVGKAIVGAAAKNACHT